MPLTPGLRHDVILGLYCLPAIILISLTGFITGHIPAASIAASGALTLAFGANKTWGGSSLSLLSTTTLGLAVSTWLGCIAGNLLPLYVGGALLYTGLYVVMANIDASAWWMLQQWAIAYLVSGNYAGTAEHALWRAGLAAMGGMIQMAFLALVFQRGLFHLRDFRPGTWIRFLKHTCGKYKHRIHLQWSVICAMLGMAAALAVVETFHLRNGYWAGMTLLICLRNNYQDTVSRVQARVLGTLIGGITAAGLTDYCSSPLFIMTGFIVTGFMAYTFSWSLIARSYGFFSFLITMMVVFMIAGFGIPQPAIATHRFEATALGGMVALAAIMLTRAVTRKQILQGDRRQQQQENQDRRPL
ncbi:FUSC family protein [Candidatus Pantoea deserta]|uniref:FUSC family protein n=1 Tax=Candidatus Pantoea deserta TaxID=1869313 RepID=A0A3N4NVC4_9GAMM|nr:FUSC family protein [Pantoea deserta]RPD99725.1 FUSC family protein [Pantoea deserta]